ncbi:MAG: aminotransferase class III-fold pyridoxal phosphate-dependent enzyme [Methanomicrobiales archaeon]|nr:aminotransferase class III-fold pyridoxal phosphate-dependent enzyme [Methanomicrobiales archaeon]
MVKAVQEQMNILSHGGFLDFCSEIPVVLAEELVDLLPRNLSRVYYSNSGAETLEAAMKLARHQTKRPYFLAFYGGFHGRTYGAMSLTAAKVIQREHFGPFLPVVHAPYPDPYHPYGGDPSRCAEAVIEYIGEEIFKREVSPKEVAAIVVEPIQGEGGYIVPPDSFLPLLRELCDEHDILLIVDEVQTGCYRTGKFLASEHTHTVPDILCLSKALGGGLPLGVTVSCDDMMTWPRGSHASTFGGNNAACVAARATLSLMKEERFGPHVREMGTYLKEKLDGLQKAHPLIGNVRGKGLMIGIELVKDPVSKAPARGERNSILITAFEKGLTLLPSGESVIRFCPPLILGRDHIDTGVEILDRVLDSKGN